MAHLMTIKVLVDDDALPKLESLIADHPSVIDSQVAGCDEIAAELEDAIVNDTYSPGDAFKAWVLFSPSADEAGLPAYWPVEYGWGDVNLATRYEPYRVCPDDRPDYGHADAVLMLDPTIPSR